MSDNLELRVETASDVVLAIHGGAGKDIRRDVNAPEFDDACRTGLVAALKAGFAVWEAGGAALDIVEAAVRTLEDDQHFNAGRGASLAYSGAAELDASIMDGKTGQAGAVAAVTTVKNPIRLARAVMEKSPFVFMVAPGAEEFADTLDLERVPNEYFITAPRQEQLRRLRETGTYSVTAALPPPGDQKMGTVGAAALDQDGNLAAATSTGGMGGKRYGRIGDSPVIGAGTWAEDGVCAISCTGHGEFFIRQAVAADIAARMKYGGASVVEAAESTLGQVTETGGAGGLVALDTQGNAVLPFNTPGMYRGYITHTGEFRIAIYVGE